MKEQGAVESRTTSRVGNLVGLDYLIVQDIGDAKAGGGTFSEVDEAAFNKVLEPIAEQFIENDAQQALYGAARAATK